MKPRIYDRNMNMIGVLQNASEVGYDRKYNDLHTASFKLPLNDPKNDLCQAMNIVEIFDGNVSKGLYRILDNPECEITAEGEWLEYSCEHVIAFLLNEVIDSYLELGGTDARTPAVLRSILAKQETVRWQLGTCDFTRQFQYSWENTNVLDALFSVPKCFDVEYHWTYDTSTFPWKVNLVQQSHDRSCEIRRKRNMVSIKRTIDSSKLCNRLYCKGYGEGVNQMTIAEVNNGKPYVEDATSQAKYGVLSSHLIDRRYTNMENLKSYGLQVLNRLKNPIVTYTAKAIDLNRITGLEWDKLDEGKMVHIVDEEKHIDVDAVIVDFRKPNSNGDPLDCEITISNETSDVSTDIESIAQRASINSQYAQGATNLYCQQFADNADETHGAVMKFYVPADCSKINEVLLNWSCSAFRAYSKGAASGGGNTITSQSGGATTITSADGGNNTVTSASGGNSTQTSTDGGGSSTTSGSGGGESITSEGGGSFSRTMQSETAETSLDGGHRHVKEDPNDTSYTKRVDSHTHGMGHTHSISVGTHTHTVNTSSHRHSVSIPSHSHNVSIPSHTHSVTLPAHTHNVTIPSHTHEVNLPNHTHDIVYGIYEGTTASSCTLKVDGSVAQTGVRSGSEIDIIRYLSKNDEGKINRSTWHTIEVVPDKMSRIEMNLFVKTFVTSHTGGNY